MESGILQGTTNTSHIHHHKFPPTRLKQTSPQVPWFLPRWTHRRSSPSSLRIVPSSVSPECIIETMTRTNPQQNCSKWDEVFPLTAADKRKPIFSIDAAPANHSCVNFTGGFPLKTKPITTCTTIKMHNRSAEVLSRSDVWWWCGDNVIYDRLPANSSGVCALISPLLPINIYPATAEDIEVMDLVGHRVKRSITPGPDPTYIDAIGIPRGVPDEYKLADQVAAGFESTICWWCTTNKNVDRINYIHYNVQKLDTGGFPGSS